MFHFSGVAHKPEYGVLIDISSGSVGVAIVSSLPNSPEPTLLYRHRNSMRVTTHGTEGIRRVRETLFSTALILSQEGMSILGQHDPHARISRLFVTCSAPWAHTMSRSVYYESDKPFKITTAVMNDLIESAEAEIHAAIEQNPDIDETRYDTVERATVDATVNDYPVEHPLHLKGKSLGLSHVAGLIPHDILDAVHEIQGKLFPQTELRTHTCMLVVYCVLRDLFPKIDSLCIIDTTGEATEIAVVEHHTLIENTSMPIGVNTLIRNIMEETNKPASDIQSVIELHDGELHADEQSYRSCTDAYVENFSQTLDAIMEKRPLPKNIVFLTQRTHQAFFVPLITKAFERSLGIKPNFLNLQSKMAPHTGTPIGEDLYLELDARFFHKMHGCGELDSQK